MRLGLRVQLLALLGALMVLAFVPLFFATAAYTRVGFENLRREKARELALSVATHVTETRSRVSELQLIELMSAQVQGGACQALFLYSSDGALVARVGEPELMQVVEPRITRHGPTGQPEWLHLPRERGPLVGVFLESGFGGVVAVARVESSRAQSEPLIQLMGLYMVVSALLVLVIAYFALTRWIVRPISALDQAAERVALGGRTLTATKKGPAEIVRLSQSLRTMTEKLREEEDSLRRKIDEVEATTEKLRAAQSSLVRSERLATVGRLAAGLAHEIGNPISALMGFEDLLLEGGLTPEEERDFLERMRKETTRIHRVLGDLLAYARPSASVGASARHAASVESTVGDVLSLLRPQKDFREMEWTADVEPDLPRVPLGQEQLTQCLLNLVMNAVDACERRGHIRVLAARGTDGRVLLAVEDDGPGISEDVAETLFEPFVSTKEVGKGTGLGLAVTRGLIEAAGGSIHLDTSHSPGARFVVTLPPVTVSDS